MYYLYNENHVYGLNLSFVPFCAYVSDSSDCGYDSFAQADSSLREAKTVVQKNSLNFPPEQVQDALNILNQLIILSSEDERIVSIIRN